MCTAVLQEASRCREIKRIIYQKELNQKIPDTVLDTVYRRAPKKINSRHRRLNQLYIFVEDKICDNLQSSERHSSFARRRDHKSSECAFHLEIHLEIISNRGVDRQPLLSQSPQETE